LWWTEKISKLKLYSGNSIYVPTGTNIKKLYHIELLLSFKSIYVPIGTNIKKLYHIELLLSFKSIELVCLWYFAIQTFDFQIKISSQYSRKLKYGCPNLRPKLQHVIGDHNQKKENKCNCMLICNFIRDSKLHDKEFERCDANEDYMTRASNATTQTQGGDEVEEENEVTLNTIHGRIASALASARAS
jgi:hypothetical protein